jgi:hypothetical protein
MALAMSRSCKHPKTGVYWLRKRVPNDCGSSWASARRGAAFKPATRPRPSAVRAKPCRTRGAVGESLGRTEGAHLTRGNIAAKISLELNNWSLILSEAHEAGSAEQRRSNKRTRTLLEGRIVFNNRFSLIECTVRDISDSGAQISFAHPVEIPDDFDLEIPKRELSVRARVRWSNGKNYGVMFISSPQPSLQSDEPKHPGEAPSDCSPEQEITEGLPTHSVREILDDARHRLAQAIGVPTSQIRLKLEVDFSQPDS